MSRNPYLFTKPITDRQIQRFHANYQVAENGCWLWTDKRLKPNGYGWFTLYNDIVYAHRFSYYYHNGSIDPNLTVDHTCHTRECTSRGNKDLHRRCVNPAHLIQIGGVENYLRTVPDSPSSCPVGHPFTQENTYIHPRGKYRSCRQCARIKDANRYPEKYAKEKEHKRERYHKDKQLRANKIVKQRETILLSELKAVTDNLDWAVAQDIYDTFQSLRRKPVSSHDKKAAFRRVGKQFQAPAQLVGYIISNPWWFGCGPFVTRRK